MKMICTTTSRTSTAIALFAVFAVMAPSAIAKHRPVKAIEPPTTVIGHLPLAGTSASQMFVHEQAGNQYLYIEQRKEGFTIVDVTKANQPRVVDRVAWPNESDAGTLRLIGADLALSEIRDGAAGRVNVGTPTQSVNVLDLRDPSNVQTLQSFSGVTGALADNDRDFVYITTTEGLWIVKHRQEQRKLSGSDGCTSVDAISDMPNC
jgi:hypothetical protein